MEFVEGLRFWLNFCVTYKLVKIKMILGWFYSFVICLYSFFFSIKKFDNMIYIHIEWWILNLCSLLGFIENFSDYLGDFWFILVEENN